MIDISKMCAMSALAREDRGGIPVWISQPLIIPIKINSVIVMSDSGEMDGAMSNTRYPR